MLFGLTSCSLSNNYPNSPGHPLMCGTTQCPQKYSQIANAPIAVLAYPGSTIINENGYSADSSKDAMPEAGRIYTVKASATQIYLFYEKWLVERGWFHCPLLATPGTAHSTMGYGLGKYQQVYIAVDDPTMIGATLGGTYSPDVTIYEVAYGYDYPSLQCGLPVKAQVPSPLNALGGFYKE